MVDVTRSGEAGSKSAEAPPRPRSGPNAAYMSMLAQQENARRTLDIAEGRLIAASRLAIQLGISEHAVDSARVACRMFCFETNQGGYVYPAFYADPAISRQDVEAVTLALGPAPASSKWQFFTTPKMSLDGRSPLQALREGHLQAVMRSAAGYIER